ncbi:hypothetical protein [Roseivirga misakiensis]|uniref:Uncharacterized protein n=1 Tax=Roseivirga misakiensis TaxID=1563681 RepID=A0A1E5T149_9BACT|nr:hypothetical protein [Roseivirga misakiensis]OEK05094.1 hypothetical protein BFP71_16890 [Roseivirga misakiensis]
MSYKFFKISIILLIFVAFGCGEFNRGEESWKLVYKHDAEGNKVTGDKQLLIDAVRAGLPVRVGFGGRSKVDSTRSVEHMADAKFLTILDGEEVFAQIDRILGQQPIRSDGEMKLRFRDANQWVKIAGTNGYSTGLMVDYLADTVVSPSTDNWRGAS